MTSKIKQKRKIIIGFIGDHDVGKTHAANVLAKKNFHRISINEKVEEFAKHLFTKEEIDANRNYILNNVRRKGVNVHKEYWLNLALISVPDDKNYIIIDDLSTDEAECNKIKVYQIYRPNISRIKLPDIETIDNDSNIGEFNAKIVKLYEKLIGHKW